MSNNVIKTYVLEQLNTQSVNILIQSSVSVEGQIYKLPNSRCSYSNSPIGRGKVQSDIPEPYSTAIFDVWGPEATVQDPPAPTTTNSESNQETSKETE